MSSVKRNKRRKSFFHGKAAQKVNWKLKVLEMEEKQIGEFSLICTPSFMNSTHIISWKLKIRKFRWVFLRQKRRKQKLCWHETLKKENLLMFSWCKLLSSAAFSVGHDTRKRQMYTTFHTFVRKGKKRSWSSFSVRWKCHNFQANDTQNRKTWTRFSLSRSSLLLYLRKFPAYGGETIF